MTEIQSVNVQPIVVSKKGRKSAKAAAAEIKQMSEIPNAQLGRDLVKPVSVIRAGSPVLDTAYTAQTKAGKATFTLARGNEVFPNIWDPAGGNYAPKRGDIIMGYGDVPKEWGISNPKVLEEMKAKGLSVYPDRAVSAEPELMYKTYVGQNGRDFTKAPLKFGETVNAEKKIFPTKYLFAKPGTLVETLEARQGSAKMPKVGIFQYIQIDDAGNPYVKDVKDLIKRLDAVGDESKGVFAKVKTLIKHRDNIRASKMPKALQEASIARLWNKTLPSLIKKVR